MHFPGLSAKLPRRHPMRLEHQYHTDRRIMVLSRKAGISRRLSTYQGAFCPYNDPSAMLQHAPGCKNHLKQSLSRAGRHTSTRLATASSTKRALFVSELVKFIVSSTKQVDFVPEVQKEDP